MKRILCFLAMIVLLCATASAQVVTLTFTGRDANNQYIQLNRVVITNLDRDWQETIYWPDTVLILQDGTGIDEVDPLDQGVSAIQLSQNNPNPFSGTTEVSLTVAEEGLVTLTVIDMNGRNVVEMQCDDISILGAHQFRVALSTAGTYVMTARQNGKTSSIKMVCNGGGSGNNIEYHGVVDGKRPMYTQSPKQNHVPKHTTTNSFVSGDQMEYVGYAFINGAEVESEHIIQAQQESENFILSFEQVQTDGLPCHAAIAVIDYDGNVYNTVQIGNQCWMKENLRTTRYSDGTYIPLGTGASSAEAYRYYPDNQPPLVATFGYGYLYNWPAVMRGAMGSFSNPSGVQGVCPEGWHVPSDSEWIQLEDYVSNRSQYVCGANSNSIAKALASSAVHWSYHSGTCSVGHDPSTNNLTGFSAFPAGCYNYGSYGGFSNCVYMWSSTDYYYYYGLDATTCVISYDDTCMNRYDQGKHNGFSVRCVQDGDGDSLSLPKVHTVAINNVTETSVTCNSYVTETGGATITARGVCWSTSNPPTINDSHTTDGIGMGSFVSNLTGLAIHTTYYVRAYATNSVGTSYGNVISFTTNSDGLPCPGETTVTDHDGNVYNTVQIGNQCWMKENLRTTSYSNGVSIPLGSSASTTTAYRYYTSNDSSNVPIYGYLYNWLALMHDESSSDSNPSGVQGICPNGWHVPSDAEWIVLTDYLSAQSQYVCSTDTTNIAKTLASTEGWSNGFNTCAVGNDPSMNNASGFSALPAGGYFSNYGAIGYEAGFWSASNAPESEYHAYMRGLHCDVAYVYKLNTLKSVGLSVRCIRDGEGVSQTLPTVSTIEVSNIRANIATCGGSVTETGGAEITARGVCWSTLSSPTLNDSHTTDGIGLGSFISSLTGLTANTTYYVRAYATNTVGTSYGNEVSFTTNFDGQPCPVAATVTDYDGNVYNTVQIGNQCWMRENMRTTSYANGFSIPIGNNTSASTAYRYYPNDDSSNVFNYGYLYNWAALMCGAGSSGSNPSEVQGVCPNGWHIPSNAEWTELSDFVSSQNRYVCGGDSTHIAKALASVEGWNNGFNICAVGHDPITNNLTGFSALPAGFYYAFFANFGYSAYFWSTTEFGDDRAYDYSLYFDFANESRYYDYKYYAFSVRCIHDGDGISQTLPTVYTAALSNVTETSAICGGNVPGTTSAASITSRGVCWSTSNPPTINDSHTTDGIGMGSFVSNLTGLANHTTYYVRAYATNSVGTSYGNVKSFTTNSDGLPCPGETTVTDYDGNVYNTVRIGNQCWMKENLRTTSYTNGVSIPLGSSASTTTAYRYYPSNDSSNVPIYGYLYNWPAVMHGESSSGSTPSGVQGICPNGWHVPSKEEWIQLSNYLSSQGQYVCGCDTSYFAKALASSEGWNSDDYYTCAVGNNPTINNATGFSALPAGTFYEDFYEFGLSANFWSATGKNNNEGVYQYFLYYSDAIAYCYPFVEDAGNSVRCIRDGDGPNLTVPTVSTSAVSNRTDTTATCGGILIQTGGVPLIARGVCWSTSNPPTLNDSHTVDGAGMGGFTSSLTGLAFNTTYYVRAYATNSIGTSYGQVESFTAIGDGQPCPGVATVTDYDGNIYNTVWIGNQCWMRENLRTTCYANGSSIPLGNNTSSTTAYRYYPNDDSSNVFIYGYLYNWPAVMSGASSSDSNPSGVQGVCPNGWHMPSRAEWTQLTDYVRSQSQYECGSNNNIAKALASVTGWNNSTNSCAVGNNPSENNATGFSAFPAGLYYLDGTSGYGLSAWFWSATEYELGCRNFAFNTYIYNTNSSMFEDEERKLIGSSVRCLHDGDGISQTLPTVYTAGLSDVTDTSATCGGNVPGTTSAASITARGVCWSTTYPPTVNDSHTTDGIGMGSFTSNLTGLAFNTTYYVRAYATNSVGTSYGSVVSFITNQNLPIVSTSEFYYMTANTAVCGGNVTETGETPVTARGVCWSTSSYPTVNDSHTTEGVGMGSFTSYITGLTVNTTYYVRAYATNSAGTSYGDMVSFTTNNLGQPCPGEATVTDYDGNTYNTVQIGNQCWMKENLRTTSYANGTSIPLGNGTNTSLAYRFYPIDSSNVLIFGYLYNWPAVMHDESSSETNPSFVQGICPTGWHVPSNAEWNQLANYVSSQSQYECNAKALASTTGWIWSCWGTCDIGNNPSTNNATGFSAFPAGPYNGYSSDFGYDALFWNATEDGGNNAFGHQLHNQSSSLSGNSYPKYYGCSVRCVRNGDGTSQTMPTVYTTAVSNITETTATCGGYVSEAGVTEVTARGVCWSTSDSPTVSDNHTVDGSGLGSFTSSLTGLVANVTYYVRAYATNSAGTSYGSVVIFITNNDGQPCPGVATVTDYDGNVYNTVRIGNQCWMKENLRTTSYANGTSIPFSNSTSSTTAYRYYPNNDSSNVFIYGYLYNWPAVMNGEDGSYSNPSGVQGICPNGWHVPSDAEWTQLTDYVSSQNQYVCGSYNISIVKALASNTGWNSCADACTAGNNTSTNNATGFSALPAGTCYGEYSVWFGSYSILWSSTPGYENSSLGRGFYYNCTGVYRRWNTVSDAYSVRCVRD